MYVLLAKIYNCTPNMTGNSEYFFYLRTFILGVLHGSPDQDSIFRIHSLYYQTALVIAEQFELDEPVIPLISDARDLLNDDHFDAIPTTTLTSCA